MANEFENLKLGTEEFAKAMKESLDKWSKEFEKIGEQIKADFPFIAYDDVYPEYGGRMRLPYSPVGAWNDMFNILVLNGYEVTVRLEEATETERELDGADKFVVIEYEEVE